MLTSAEIRQAFLDFFASKEHHIVPSAPMVIKDDPTLMFTNAGMNQFKDIILGNAPIKYPRIADSQKCLRVSGKHNDLEEVGHDTYHHTMFEMLGNWSFGNYFKQEAISWAWEFLVDVLGLDKDRIYVTVFEGSPEENLERDNEAASFWKAYLSEDRIIDGNKKDNFWEMGDTGPCGPCSEIHIDLRPDNERREVEGRSLVNHDHPQVIEIWNLVFMQYNRKADGTLEPLPNKVIDTGMGFERLCMALQGKTSNYDTDIFQPIIQKIASDCRIPYGSNPKTDVAMRVIADHIRTIAFSITDGQLPSNAKAGYVIRRILRRAVRYGYTFLERKEAYMYSLIPTLIEVMGEAYPELPAQQNLVQKVMKEEEESFLRTLETGIHILEGYVEALKAEGNKVLQGSKVFELYDRYGFPTDLTELILREHGLESDLKGFEVEMNKQKERARNAAAIEAKDWVELSEGSPEFTGYDFTETTDAHILRYRQVTKKKQTYYQIVMDKSPFYAEMGGQVGDTGVMIGAEDGESITIQDTVRENNLPIHIVEALPKNPSQPFTLKVDVEKRIATECNHTATHLLHEALREVLGTHVEQKGSYVSSEVLRFDFAHFSKMTQEEIRLVERKVTEKIRENLTREEMRNIPIAEAKAMGAMALFGEKYGEEVRVIRYGNSIELCGGTHISATGRIGTFRIVSESSIAAGIRRIEAVTAKHAEDYLYGMQTTIQSVQELFHNAPNVVQAIHKLLEEDEALRREIREAAELSKRQIIKELLSQDHPVVNGVKVIQIKQNLKPEIAKDVAFTVKAEIGTDSFVCLAGSYSEEEKKCTITLMLGDAVVSQGANAGALVRAAGKFIQGGGGGQPHFATAGGKNPQGLDEALDFILGELQLR